MSESSAPAPVQVVNVSPQDPATQAAPPQPQAPEPKTPETKPDDKFAAKFAALTRKEREVRERETKWKSEADAIKAEAAKAKEEAAQFRDKYGRFASLEESIKTDKRAAIKWALEQGASVEELSDALLEEMNPSPDKVLQKTTSEIEKRMMEKIAALEAKLTAKEQAELEAQKKAETDNFEKTVTQVKNELKQVIDSSDEYELIKLNESYDTVLEVMQEHYERQISDGVSPDKVKILSYEEAANFTETFLDQQATKQYEAKRAKLAAKAPTGNEPAKPKTTSPTLSNTLSTEVQTGVEPKAKTREESLKRAARLLRYIEE
jgi:hypothetical protein